MSQHGGRPLLVVLWLDAVILAILEVFFLPLRLDGSLLPEIGGVPFPVTALVAALTTPWLVAAAARISPRSPVAGSPLLVWLAVLLAAWFITPGGVSALLPDWRSLLLLGAGAIPAAAVLGGVLGTAARRRAAQDKPASAGTGHQDMPGEQA